VRGYAWRGVRSTDNELIWRKRAQSLAFECCAEEITVAPDQPALAKRSEAVERDAEAGRNDVEAVQSQSGTVVGNVSNNTGVNYFMPSEVHQHVAIDCRTAKSASFDVIGGGLLKDFAERLHQSWLTCKKEPGRTVARPTGTICGGVKTISIRLALATELDR
jgi:hypothetical protein